jgi:membrane protein YdbS with pleckstrin-like domain
MERYCLGPHSSYEYYLILRNPLLWIGLVLFVIPFIGLDLSQSFPFLRGMVDYHYLIYLAGVLCVVGAIAVSHWQYKATTFVIEQGMLFVTWGLVRQVSLTVPLRFILDCDISCGPNDQLFGVKSLHLTVMGRVAGGASQLSLKFIKHAEDWRLFLLANSAAGGDGTTTWLNA